MPQYFALFYDAQGGQVPVLKSWRVRLGDKIRKGAPLFEFSDGNTFPSPISGTIKIFLMKEGEALHRGAEIAVLSIAPTDAKDYEKKQLGKIIHPEELKELAEAASIRMPSE